MDTQFSELIGKTLVEVKQEGDDRITFKTTDGGFYVLFHSQDCCESVTVESIVGDLADLVGEPILKADEVTSAQDPEGYKDEYDAYRESFKWTFYKLATRKGFVDIRWLGESNGYYSESVEFVKLL